ncbi:GH25 family lysozyme [Nonomuraea sp. NPDC049129]|uniref:GH25 family lysozyme n=1 Tax=Nonomuraea sp. NPDC049129 TaxID=3155272 RepID=UPI0033CD4B1E
MSVRLWRIAVAALVAVGLAGTLVQPASASSANPDLNRFPVKGVDITEYQHPGGASVNWSQIRASGVTFATLKATRGTNKTNAYFSGDLSQSLAQGIATAPYHFLIGYSANTAGAQADYFIAALRAAGYTGHRAGELPPILDMEWTDDGNSSCPPYTTVAQAQIWLDKVQSAFGVKPWIYTARGFMTGCMSSTTAFASYPLQVADYTSGHTTPAVPPGWSTWLMWQYADVGSVPGVPTTNVTLNVFNGTHAQLDALSRHQGASDDSSVGQATGDFNGDGRADGVMVYHFADNSIGLYTSLADANGGLQAFSIGYSVPAAAGWDWNAFRLLTGDFNGDGRSDLAIMYHHTDGSISMHTSLADTNGHLGSFAGSYSVPAAAGWDWNAIRLLPGDTNGDGRADAVMEYHFADNSIGLYTSLADANGGLQAFSIGYSVPAGAGWDWNAFKTVAGDFNGDGRSDLAIMYRHSDGSISMHTSLADTSGHLGSFVGSYSVPAAAGWDWNAIRLLPGDTNGDGRADAVMEYHFADNSIGLYTSLADANGGLQAFSIGYSVPSGAGWDWNAFKTISGDFNGDHRSDLAIMYRHTDGSISMHTSLADPNGHLGSFAGSYTVPAAAGWDWNAIRFV